MVAGITARLKVFFGSLIKERELFTNYVTQNEAGETWFATSKNFLTANGVITYLGYLSPTDKVRRGLVIKKGSLNNVSIISRPLQNS